MSLRSASQALWQSFLVSPVHLDDILILSTAKSKNLTEQMFPKLALGFIPVILNNYVLLTVAIFRLTFNATRYMIVP